jgi:cytochrome b subunit of formate dehydrogenase
VTRRGGPVAVTAAFALAAVWLGAGEAAAQVRPGPRRTSATGPMDTSRDRECLVCHAGVGDEKAPKLRLDAYRASAHASVGCVGCHQDITDDSIQHEQPDQDLRPVDCARCHADQGALFARSVHRAGSEGAERKRPTCSTCHGTHDILPPTDFGSRVNPVNQLDTCGQCHGVERQAAGHRLDVQAEYRDLLPTATPLAVQKLTDQGQLVIAGCASCHRAHDIAAPDQPGSSLYGEQAVATCGTCHADQRRQFSRSAHAAALARQASGGARPGARSPPTCATCHPVHRTGTPRSARFRFDLVRECGTCHAELMKSYQESYHGKATLLGDATVAKCSDCHGNHEILPPTDPASTVNPRHKPDTCRRCHQGAPDRFAKYWPHADPHRRDRYPALFWVWLLMTGLLASTFSFFGLHTLLWGIRESVDAVRERRKPRHKQPGGLPITRFNRFHRIVHAFVIISFLGLAATGAPLKFAHTGWAGAIFAMVGGVSAAGWLHRIFAVVTFGYFSAHIFYMIRGLRRHARKGSLAQVLLGPDSLMPRLDDVRDIVAQFRWFVGAGPRPTFDRWTYWEKFDYWAVFWGVAVIGTTGLVLWFPAFFSHFLPGWVINIALIVHSDEALLAIGFIFGVHFFNSHLRRNKFPMDPVIFTGTVPEAEFKEERGREWARLEATGQLEERRGKVPGRLFLRVVHVLGIAAWLTGLTLLGLILHGVFLS